MKIVLNRYLVLFFVLVLSTILCCCDHYERRDNCHLDKMNINGDVIKIETVVQSTIPLTELFYDSYDPSSSIAMITGNFVYEIDNHGNIKKHIGYGINGELLFDTPFNEDSLSDMSPAVFGLTNQKITKIETVKSSNNRIVNTKYYSNSELIMNQKVSYNDRGDMEQIIKNYSFFESPSSTYADTTTFKYLSYDDTGNWTKLLVDYKGFRISYNHQYTVLRQITYYGEEKHPALMDRYKEINTTKEDHINPSLVTVEIGQYGKISIPKYMALAPDDFISFENKYKYRYSGLEYYLMSEYDKEEAYATFLISRIHLDDNTSFDDLYSSKELQYSKELDEYFEQITTEQMASKGKYILKWLPYRFETLSGKLCMKLSFYQYGIGSPIPVYCESYTIQTGGDYSLTIMFSFQSNLKNRFLTDFENAIHSIVLY